MQAVQERVRDRGVVARERVPTGGIDGRERFEDAEFFAHLAKMIP